jgi:imidazolonepropionase-like amidohydrolase
MKPNHVFRLFVLAAGPGVRAGGLMAHELTEHVLILFATDEFIRETRRQCKRGVDLIKIADSTWGDVQTVADDEIAAVVDEAHRHNVKVTIHSRGSTSTRAAAKAGVDLIYHADLATQADLDIIAKAGMPLVPVLTSPCSNCAKDSRTLRVKRPIDVVVLNCCVTETNPSCSATLDNIIP